MQIDWNGRTEFSWLKAIGHSIAFGCIFVLPAIAVSVAGVVNAEAAGEFSGGFVLLGCILGWFWSYARQRRHFTVSHLLLFVVVGMSAYHVFVLAAAAVTRANKPTVSELETQPLVTRQTPMGLILCQQDMGVNVVLGTLSLAPAPDLAATLRESDPNDAIARWVFRDQADNVVVLLAATGFDSEESLHTFSKGAVGAAAGRMDKVHESVVWSGDHGSIDLSFRKDEARFDMRCVSRANGDLACLQTIGSGTDGLAVLRQGLSFAPCP